CTGSRPYLEAGGSSGADIIGHSSRAVVDAAEHHVTEAVGIDRVALSIGEFDGEILDAHGVIVSGRYGIGKRSRIAVAISVQHVRLRGADGEIQVEGTTCCSHVQYSGVIKTTGIVVVQVE